MVCEGVKLIGCSVHDVRFPTSITGDGSDALNKDCNYSAAYVVLETSDPALRGYGMTFTIGRGNDLICLAITRLCRSLIGKALGELFSDMGATYTMLTSDSQLRWIGPEKGVIHLAVAALVNALWDAFARACKKPLWKLVCDMTPQELVKCIPFRYISDAMTKEEALELLEKQRPHKEERVRFLQQNGYPAYTTSIGWSGYSDEKVIRLTHEAIKEGFNHFKIKVGENPENDLRRLALVRSIIDDPANFEHRPNPPAPESLEGKNAGPTGCVLMIDSNQVWDVPQAIEWVQGLESSRPWFIEEPTSPDDILGHAAIRKALKPHGIGVATGEQAHNRIVFKQLLQAEAIDVCQIDSCRLGGVNEVLAVLLMSAKFGVPVCPHAGGVGLCELVSHLAAIDYIAISGSIDRNVLEYVDHLHEHFPYRCTLNERGRYNLPTNPSEGYSIEMKPETIEQYSFPNGTFWVSNAARESGAIKQKDLDWTV